LVDALIKGCKSPGDFFGESGLMKTLVKSILERAMSAEMAEHLGYPKHNVQGKNSGHSRNGYSEKTVSSHPIFKRAKF
jgi:putative transposase